MRLQLLHSSMTLIGNKRRLSPVLKSVRSSAVYKADNKIDIISISVIPQFLVVGWWCGGGKWIWFTALQCLYCRCHLDMLTLLKRTALDSAVYFYLYENEDISDSWTVVCVDSLDCMLCKWDKVLDIFICFLK